MTVSNTKQQQVEICKYAYEYTWNIFLARQKVSLAIIDQSLTDLVW